MIFLMFYECTLYVIANFCVQALECIFTIDHVHCKSWWYLNAKLLPKIYKTMMLIGSCVDIDVPPICDRYQLHLQLVRSQWNEDRPEEAHRDVCQVGVQYIDVWTHTEKISTYLFSRFHGYHP